MRLGNAYVFFNLRVVSKSPSEISMAIGAVLELRSRANLPFSKTGPKFRHWVGLGMQNMVLQNMCFLFSNKQPI